ncbi:MAG: aminopeptidase P family protein [Candidatus Eremiobacteraeota bacterium]|nr:aminopeptidase P family protein [Candidatus Eremiobacteraeota bacterium]
METRPAEQTPKKASHDAETPSALIEFLSSGWIDEQPASEALPNCENYRARREALSRAYPGSYLVIPCGEEQVRANDTNFRFRPSSDFAYLVGGGDPGAVLVLEPDGSKHDSLLFVAAHNRGEAEFLTDRVYGELWVGRHRGVEESKHYYGVENARPIAQAKSYLEELKTSGFNVKNVAHDSDFATHLGEMRLIKDDIEIAELRKCCEITKRAFEDVIRILPSAKSEREVEAAFWSRARIEANDVGYLTIAASGAHACTLHWNHNTGKLDKQALLLLDAGVEVESLYTADITRTLPIGGKFSAEQRTVYNLVYEAQQAAFAAVTPGNDFLEPHRSAMKVLAQGLIDLGILKMSLEEALDPDRQFYRRYTLHGVSHMLGIDVHDCAKARSENYRHGALKTGMVLTVEPGLYFQPDDATVPEKYRGIGVRLEDDVVVTATGYENLSGIFPVKPDDVEAWMRNVTGRLNAKGG